MRNAGIGQWDVDANVGGFVLFFVACSGNGSCGRIELDVALLLLERIALRGSDLAPLGFERQGIRSFRIC